MDFESQNGAKLAPKLEPKSIPTSKSDFFEKPRFSNGKTIILKVPGVEVEAKNRSKIDQKLKFSWEGLIFSIFMDFGPFLRPSWRHVGVQVDPKSMRKRH